MLQKHTLQTPKDGFYDITFQVQRSVAASLVREGLAVVYCPHTTAAITVNENADPSVLHDLALGLERAFPDRSEFRHAEGNSKAHLKASAIGASQTFIIESGKPLLGTWQGIYFCEFDAPRSRTYYVKIVGQ
ncbi:MAG: secondary thiamine-phosphate synthase enzyme YjbQ [Deltaproteobacteria bacterium]|jgi:secondary thiamine-phosphate synthase enzyme|nr:secondary thiamine-phosphate synthase enzyme YjbQ [Deltaproteobacteria bacterium]